MHLDTEQLVITTDSDGVNAVEAVARSEDGAEFAKRRIQAQAGDPDTWVMVGQTAHSAWPAVSAALLLLIRQRKIKRIKLGDEEYENITPEQFERILEARRGRPHGSD
jgi:hypothetical protein